MKHDPREFEYQKELARAKMQRDDLKYFFYFLLCLAGIFTALAIIEVIFRPMTLQ